MSKEDIVKQYSNPSKVRKKMRQYFGDDMELFYSTRKNKKYMIFDNENNKYIHFGQIPYEDYTKHKDEERRQQFLKRNKKWSEQDKMSSGWLSYHLLW